MKQNIFVLFVLSCFLIGKSSNSVIIEHDEKEYHPQKTAHSIDGYLNTVDQSAPLSREQRSLLLAEHDAFASVGYFHLVFINKAKTRIVESFCTGTLIDTRSVLTTADCVKPLIEHDDYSLFYGRDSSDNLFVLGNDVFSEPTAASYVENAVYYTGYQPEASAFAAQNLALLFLREPITSVAPAHLYEGKLSSLYKKYVVYVGFGFSGDPVNGVKRHVDYRKRACEQKVSGYKRSLFQTEFERSSHHVSGMFTHGDQGGPAFVKDDIGNWYLAGVNAFRILPKYDQDSEVIKKDPRLVTYGTVGNSLAVPVYLSWIREHMGQKLAERSEFAEDSEWSFHPYWNKHRAPNNRQGHFYDVHLLTPGIVMLDGKYQVDNLLIDHAGANLYLPRASVIAATDEDIDDRAAQYLSAGKPFLAVEFRRLIDKRIDDKLALKRSQFFTKTVSIKSGILNIDGELWVDEMNIAGGTLLGSGDIHNAMNPVVNLLGQVSPGTIDARGKLTIWGDYEQQDGATLSIRVHKSEQRPGHIRLEHDVLAVKGRVMLRGTLEIIEQGLPLVHGDKLHLVHGTNGVVGEFNEIKLPLRFHANAYYGRNDLTIEIIDTVRMMLSNADKLSVQWGQEISLADDSKFQELEIDGGILQGRGLVMVQSPLTLKRGIMRTGNSAEAVGTMIIDGDYQQTGGTLALKMIKNLEEKRIESAENLPIIKPVFTWEHDALHVNGTATLGGNLELLIAPEARLNRGHTMTILRAENIVGQFDTVSEFPGTLQPVVSYTATEVTVQFVARTFHDMTATSNDPKIAEVAEFLDALRSNEDQERILKPLFAMLDLVDKRNLPSILRALVSQQFNTEDVGKKSGD